MPIPLFRMPESPFTALNVKEVLASTWWSAGGKFAKQLEKWFAEYTGTSFAIACNSGTAACRAALFACLEASPHFSQQKVIAPTFSCGANLSPVMEFRGQPIFVDAELETFGMDHEILKVTNLPEISAAFLPYLYGEPPRDLDLIFSTLRDAKVKIICDLSECVGIDPRFLLGDVYVASVRAEKMLGCGEGGLVSTNDANLYQRMQEFCNRGKSSHALKYWYTSYGDNVLMPHMSAALAVGQLNTLQAVVDGKRKVADMYRNNSTLRKFFDWQTHTKNGVAWLNCGLLKPQVGILPQDLITALASFGIECRPAFYPLPLYWQNYTGVMVSPDTFAGAKEICERGIILPSPHDLMDGEFQTVVDSIERIIG